MFQDQAEEGRAPRGKGNARTRQRPASHETLSTPKMAVQSMPVPSAVQPPHCSRLVSASMHSKPSPRPVEQAMWCEGHSIERLRLREAGEAASAQIELPEHQPVSSKTEPVSCGGLRRTERRAVVQDAPEAQMLSTLQPKPLGTPAEGISAHFCVVASHD